MGASRRQVGRITDAIGVLAVITAMVMGLVPGIGIPEARADDGKISFSSFEIDGNTGGTNDFDHYTGSEKTADGVGNTDPTWFTPSTRESDYGSWTFKTGGNTSKADLIRNWVQTQTGGPNENWVALAVTRDSDNGNAQITAEFNKSQLTNYEGTFRSDGDFYLRFNFPGNVKGGITPAQAVEQIDARYAIWDDAAQAFGPEQLLDSGSQPAVRAAIAALDGSNNLTFIELIIDLEVIFSNGELDECTTFGSAGFRSEATGANDNNDNTTLKDVILPFPIDLSNCVPVSVQKQDDDGEPLSGVEFTLFTDATLGTPVPETQDGVTSNPCVTDADGACSFGVFAPGETYWIDETDSPAGYGTDVDLPDSFVVGEAGNTLTYTNPRLPYTIDVDPNGRNAVGNDHEFTVSLTSDGAPVAGETVDLSWSGVGDGITDVDGTGFDPGVSATTCVTSTAGTCLVTVSSDDPGPGDLTAAWDTPYQNTVAADGSATTDDGDGTTTPFASISDSANKVWIGYRAEIAETGLNLVGQPHLFTATVYEVDGTTPDDVATGVTVTFDWDEGTAAGSSLNTATCVTDLTGTCTVVANDGGTPGTGTISIVNVDGVVGDEEALSVDFAAGDISATKTWREYRVTLDSDSVNPSGEDHTFTATIEYRDDEALAWQAAPAGTTVSAYTWTGDGSVKVADSTCLGAGTSGGTCTFVVTSTAPGSGTLEITEVEGALLGDAGELDETFAVSDDATKTWLDFEVDVTPDGDNLAGEDHVFTIYVEEYDGSNYVPIADGSTITFSLSDGGASYVSDTCDSTLTGACTVTVNSGTAGSVTLTATGLTGYGEFDDPADITFDGSNDTDGVTDEAGKTWYEYRAFIEADGVNLVGDEHTFTVTAQVNDGTGWTAVEDDTVVAVSANGIAADVDQTDCADGTTAGTCQVVVDSDAPGKVTISVETVGNLSATDSAVTTVDVSDGTDLEQDQSVSADKTWVAYRASIAATATNLTGQEHVFDVTAEQNDGSGWTDVPDGTAVSFSTTNDGTVQSDTCDSTAAGACTITVDSSSVAAVTVTVTGVSAEDVDGDPTATVANRALSAAAPGLAATKTWIDVSVDVDADGDNVVGEDHEFTVKVTVNAPGGSSSAGDGTTVVVSPSGAVGGIESQTCDDPGTSGGECTVTVGSDAPGELTVTAESVSFTYDSTDFVVDLDGVEGVANIQDRTATKTWYAYRAFIAADGLNLVRDAHTFTVTAQVDDGSGWAAVEDGTVVTVSASGVAADVDQTDCADGTTAGTCDVVVDHDAPGAVTISVETVGNLSADDSLLAVIDVSDGADLDAQQSASADKTWVAFRADIGSDSVNLTGDAHDFTVLTEYTVDGSTWLPVPDGSTVTYSDDEAVGTTATDTCDSTGTAVGDGPGECTVTVDSDDSGVREVTVTGVTAQITAAGLTETFSVTFGEGKSGVASFTATDYSATKTWASYSLVLTPPNAFNLLPVDPDHTYTATLTSDDAVNAPVGGQTIDVTISGDVGTIKSVEDGSVAVGGLSATCITAADGTCDIVVTSTTPGDAEIGASYEANVGDSAGFTVGPVTADKTWTTFRVTVTPEQAVNLVGNTHTFTVLVETSSADGVWTPVEDAVPSIDVTSSVGNLVIDASDCEDGTAEDGTCAVDVTSDDVQAITLTAEYEASIDQSTAAFTDSGDKDWIDYAIDVSPDTDENLVNTDHVFTVTVTTTFPGEDGAVTQPVVGATPTLDLAGQGSIISTTCADPGTDTTGACKVTIRSSAPGGSTLTATYLGTAADDDEIRAYDDSGDKLWVDYLLVIDEDATNLVGDPHTFTAKLTVDTGNGFGPAAGEELQFALDGVGSATGGDVDLGDLTCATDDGGLCTIVINSDEAGATTVSVSYDAVVGATSRTDGDEAVKQWVDIELVKTPVVGDGFSDGDLIDDPEAFPFLFFTSSDPGPKTAVFEYEITNPSNVTLVDVDLVDDRLGTIDLSLYPDCQVLDPGETCTARASEQFDYVDATTTFTAPITNVGVVTAASEDGVGVTDTDDATISLVAVQSSILIDLVKEVVDGAGDVTVVDGLPIVSWSEEEYNAGVSKDVTYRFTVTNISNSPIIDVELVDPMISDQPIIAKSDGVTLAPDESITVEVDYVLTVAQAFPDGELPSKIDNVASVSGSNETRDSFSEDVDDASVFSELVFAEVIPATGFGAAGLVPVSMLLVSLGVAILWLERRRTHVG